jgi:hypothetical protein
MASTIQLTESVFFVDSRAALTETLFTGPRTASGTFERRKRGILLRDPKGLARAYICANDPLSPFIVSCSMVTDKNGRKRICYMQALCHLDAMWLGLGGASYSEERAAAAAAWQAP